ncbi:hypothetical protein IGI04_009614 [Brassica rapa subsp. trilocularis]|uniref:CCT-beta n=1 Tax=Brassica rapa subsp. trilocularis TaxID=1813537 RepID=A0ABQ7N0C1_BRACM|nr:hypothetical protein IGI04_009614 [Brassica rapa subsp. trilocularis]
MAATQLTSSPVTVSARSFSELRTQGCFCRCSQAIGRPSFGEDQGGRGKDVVWEVSYSHQSKPQGAQIIYSKYAGTEVEFNGEKHLILKEDDIVGLLETEDIKDLKPLNDRVFIKVAEAEEKTAGGLLLPKRSLLLARAGNDFKGKDGSSCILLRASDVIMAILSFFFYTVVSRVATVLKTRYTATGFWVAGLSLFEEAERLVSDTSEKKHLKSCIEQAKEQLTEVDIQPTEGYLFEGHLTVDREPPQPQWLVQQNLMSAFSSIVAGESSNAAAAAVGNVLGETANLMQELINGLDSIIPERLDDTMMYSMRILEDGGPPRAPPASKEVVEKLPVIVFSEEMLKKLGAEVECYICKENLVIGDKMQELPCKHTFHPPCLKPWLVINKTHPCSLLKVALFIAYDQIVWQDEHNSCPICRHELPTDDQKYESWKEREKEAEEERKGAENAVRGGEYMYDKILQSTGRGHSVTVTNDGTTILKSLHIDNPAAKVLVDISKVQDDEVGDGTTSVVVLAGELLREAEKLVTSKIHPMTIIAGYRMAAECARDALLKRVIDNKENAEKFRSDLMKIAMTTLCSKILSQDKEHFAEMAVDAVFRLKGSTNLEAIQIIKKPGGSLRDSFLDEGFILDKKIGIGQPKRIENAKILVANTAMDTDKVKIYGARVRVDSMTKVAQIEGAEKEKMKDKVNKILAHGINCFVNRQLIYNFPEELFADAGVLAIEHADFEGIERLGLVTGGEIASTFDNPESVKLGHCKLIEEIMIGEDKLIHFSGVEMGQACSIVLRGASHHVLDEAERSLHDALCVLSQTVNDSRVLLGGGWPEMVMAKEVDELARKTAGKKSHAIEAFSRALVAIPTTIADNAGLDSAELVAQLRAEHHTEGCNAGIDVISGAVGDMEERGIYEAFKVKQAVLLSATEAAEMILRVDEIITCAPRRREDRM